MVNNPSQLRSSGSFDHGFEFHHEDDTWWAECNDFPGHSAVANSREELGDLITAGLEFLTGEARSWYAWWFGEVGDE